MAKPKSMKPEEVYVKTSYLFTVRQVTEALGMTFEQGQIVGIYCEGLTKVRVEVCEPQ